MQGGGVVKKKWGGGGLWKKIGGRELWKKIGGDFFFWGGGRGGLEGLKSQCSFILQV